MTATVTSYRSNAQRWSVGGGMRDTIAVGILGFAVGLVYSWQPSLWYDEAATISATTRSWPELWRMLGNVDAVHGMYYAVMHLWFDVVGYSPFTLRLPSALAVGLAAALVVLLVRSLASRQVALAAGVLFCVFPRVTWMGGEGRSYALTAALAVGMTMLFLRAWRAGADSRSVRVRWWILYGALSAISTAIFLYLAPASAPSSRPTLPRPSFTAPYASIRLRRRGSSLSPTRMRSTA